MEEATQFRIDTRCLGLVSVMVKRINLTDCKLKTNGTCLNFFIFSFLLFNFDTNRDLLQKVIHAHLA